MRTARTLDSQERTIKVIDKSRFTVFRKNVSSRS